MDSWSSSHKGLLRHYSKHIDSKCTTHENYYFMFNQITKVNVCGNLFRSSYKYQTCQPLGSQSCIRKSQKLYSLCRHIPTVPLLHLICIQLMLCALPRVVLAPRPNCPPSHPNDLPPLPSTQSFVSLTLCVYSTLDL